MESVEELLKRYLTLEIAALERAARDAEDADRKQRSQEKFQSAAGPATASVGVVIMAALVFAGFFAVDVIDLFAPGHTSAETLAIFSKLGTGISAEVTSFVSSDNLKAAAAALFALVVAHAAINRTLAALVAITLINLLLGAEFIVIAGADSKGFPLLLVYGFAVTSALITTLTIERLLPLGVHGYLSERPLPAWETVKQKVLAFVHRHFPRPDLTWITEHHWLRRVWALASMALSPVVWFGTALALPGILLVVVWNLLLRFAPVLWLGLILIGFCAVCLVLGIVVLIRIGALTKPGSLPRAMTFMVWVPVGATLLVTSTETLFNLTRAVNVLTLWLAFVEVLAIAAFVAWFVWAEIAANFAAKVLFLTVFAWLCLAVFLYGSNPVALLTAAVLSISFPRAIPD